MYYCIYVSVSFFQFICYGLYIHYIMKKKFHATGLFQLCFNGIKNIHDFGELWRFLRLIPNDISNNWKRRRFICKRCLHRSTLRRWKSLPLHRYIIVYASNFASGTTMTTFITLCLTHRPKKSTELMNFRLQAAASTNVCL